MELVYTVPEFVSRLHDVSIMTRALRTGVRTVSEYLTIPLQSCQGLLGLTEFVAKIAVILRGFFSFSFFVFPAGIPKNCDATKIFNI